MRRSLSTLLSALSLYVGAQPTPRSLLWSVTAPMGESSYLYGTFHGRDARVFQFQDSVMVAFAACDIVAGELEVSGTRRLDNAVMNAMLLPNGSSLDRLYNKRDFQRVIGGLKQRLGPLAPMCTKLRPFYTVAMLSETELSGDSAIVLDAWFQQRAQNMGKKVVGLETITEQLAAVERVPLRDQARLLFDVITRDAEENGMQAAMNAYTARDLDALMSLVERDGLPEHADKALLDVRNSRMADRMAQHMVGGHRVFAAVGAAHLPGDNGLIAGLRARGFVVRPIAPVLSPVKVDPVSAWDHPKHNAVLPPSTVLKRGVHIRNDTLGYAVDMPAPPTKQVEQEDDTLRICTWTATSADGQLLMRVTTFEGSSIERTDARTRIERSRDTMNSAGMTASSLTRIDGAQAFVAPGDPVLGDHSRSITVDRQ